VSVFGLKALLFVAALLATALIWFALIKAPAMGKETGDAMFAARATAAPITAAPPVIQNTSAAASLATVPSPPPVVPPAAPEPVKALQAPTGGTTATPSAMAAPEPKVVDVSRLYRVKADKVMATFKRTVDVEIFKHESEATLAAICRQLKAANPVVVDRTFINFDVRGEPKPPQMSNWAIARFDPELSVRILGDE